MMGQQVEFGFMIAASDVEPTPDLDLYRGMIEDARFGYELGFRTVWTPEHHFSSYFPTPSPLMLMSNIAARCPGLGLGTMVLVTPWHNPVRLAGEIAMLSLMSDAPLHLGLGRGAMKAVVRDGKIEARLLTPIALSYDHRVIDGGSAARFTVDLVKAFENFSEDAVKL